MQQQIDRLKSSYHNLASIGSVVSFIQSRASNCFFGMPGIKTFRIESSQEFKDLTKSTEYIRNVGNIKITINKMLCEYYDIKITKVNFGKLYLDVRITDITPTSEHYRVTVAKEFTSNRATHTVDFVWQHDKPDTSMLELLLATIDPKYLSTEYDAYTGC
jgi:hypothetical protein